MPGKLPCSFKNTALGASNGGDAVAMPRLTDSETFRRYQWARLLVILGSEAQSLAVSWQVFQLTHSALSLGWTGFWLLLPGVIFFPIAGDVADRYNRKHVIIIAYAAQAAFTLALLLITLYPPHTLFPLYGVLFGIGAGRCFSGPASNALLPTLVSEQQLAEAVTWTVIVFQCANVAGPIVGGLLFTRSWLFSPKLVGAATVYLFTLVTICLFLFLLASMTVEAPQTPHHSRQPGAWHEGLFFVLRSRKLFVPILLDLFAAMLGGAVTLMPIFATEVLHSGATGLGVLRATPGIGALAASLALCRRPGWKHSGAHLALWTATFSIGTIIFASSRSMPLSLLALLVVGASQMLSLVGRSTMIQEATPAEMRGRVSAINWILLGTSNELGGLESGLTAHWFGAVRAVAFGGIASLVTAGVAAIAFRRHPADPRGPLRVNGRADTI